MTWPEKQQHLKKDILEQRWHSAKLYLQQKQIIIVIAFLQNRGFLFYFTSSKYVSESDILGPIDHCSDIENLVSFERAMLADYSLRNKMKIFPFLSCLYHHFEVHA